MNKAVFLDRDNTINYDYGYISKIEDFKFLDGAVDGLKILYDMGYMLIIISNQSGIGRGYFTIEDYKKLNTYMLEELLKKEIKITDSLYCPHIDEDKCNCRKPKTKLFYDAIKKYDIDLEKSYAIGDRERDLCICNETPVKGIILSDNQHSKYINKKNLYESALYIKKQNN